MITLVSNGALATHATWVCCMVYVVVLYNYEEPTSLCRLSCTVYVYFIVRMCNCMCVSSAYKCEQVQNIYSSKAVKYQVVDGPPLTLTGLQQRLTIHPA